MGQGRHIRLVIRCTLLIVSTIQGITPDARSLVSPLAIRLLWPDVLGPSPIVDEDQAYDETCEAVRSPRIWQTGQPDEIGTHTEPFDFVGRSCRHCCVEFGAGLTIVGDAALLEDLSLSLCRLVC